MRSAMLQTFTLHCKIEGFLDDITALMMVKNREVAEVAKKVMKKKKEVEDRPQIVGH